jgi:mannose-6-phosphate isomerase-like protein (cupin superfamily)
VQVVNLQSAKLFSPEKLKKNLLFQTDRLMCDLYCLEPGQDQKPHLHTDSDKVYIVLEGEGRFRVGGEEAKLATQMSVLAPAGLEHGVQNDGPGRLTLLVVMAPKPHPTIPTL